tara:strand:+ start:7078 stop:8976 length:1899 start_codon:yes stop_codon:yes gene_type:complete
MSFGKLANVKPETAKLNQLLYTAPADTLTQGKVYVTNQTPSTIYVRVGLATAGGLDSFKANGYVTFDQEIKVGEYFESDPLYFADGDSVVIRSTDTSSAFTFIGEESPNIGGAGFLAQGFSTADNGADLLFEFPTGKSFRGNLFVCNKSSGDSKVRVGLGTTATDYLEYNYEVERNSTHVRSDISAKPGDQMYVRADSIRETEHTIQGITYNPNTGFMTIQINAHKFVDTDRVYLKGESVVLTCAKDDYLTKHYYPRSTDPIYNKWIPIYNVTTNTFDIQVLDVIPSTNVTDHKFISAHTNGLRRTTGAVNFVLSGYYVDYQHFYGSVGIGSTLTATNAYIKEGLGIGVTYPGSYGLKVIGDTSLSKLDITDDLHVQGNVQTVGVSTFAGTVTFQGGTVNTGVGTENAVVLDANVNSNITPGVANSFDLGQDSKRWRYVYYADTLRGNQIDLSNGTTGIATIGVGFGATTTQAIIGAANTAVMAFGDIGINGDLVLKGQIGIGTTTVNQLAYDATTDELQVFNKSLNRNVPIHGVDTNYYTVTSNTTVTSWSTVMVDTLGGTFTVTLPASPVQGDRIRFIDYKKNFDTAALTIGRNGKPIMGDGADMTVNTEGAAFELMFWDNTSGWCLMNV